jgi:thiol-disulfide isomerase/thioredoxin
MKPILLLLFLLCSLPMASPALSDGADFSLKDTKGKVVKLSDFRGRWVVVNFWTTWCTPCVKEMPELITFQQRFPAIQMLGVNFEQRSEQELRPFLKRFDFNYPILLLSDIPLTPFEPLKGLPTTAIIDPHGEMISKHTGPVTAKTLETFFRKEGAIKGN